MKSGVLLPAFRDILESLLTPACMHAVQTRNIILSIDHAPEVARMSRELVHDERLMAGLAALLATTFPIRFLSWLV